MISFLLIGRYMVLMLMYIYSRGNVVCMENILKIKQDKDYENRQKTA